MAVVKELIREESDGSISFGNYTLAQKAKLEDFEHAGDLYKVKTFSTMTKLEKTVCFYTNPFQAQASVTFRRLQTVYPLR